MPKVTEKLRQQWTSQRAQMLEERTETQHGIPRSESDIAVVDFDVAVMDKLLSLPLGATFDAQRVQKDLMSKRRSE